MSKINLVADHLIDKICITSWDAIHLYGATRLADIVHTLKSEGWDIATELHQNGNTRFAKYHLISCPIKRRKR